MSPGLDAPQRGPRTSARRLAVRALVLALLVAACGNQDERVRPAERAPQAIGDHECAVCGMLVRDQPAPRGQVVHRDGSPAFACSLGDLLVYLSAPSPHGHAETVWVEVIAPEVGAGERSLHDHPWRLAEDAWFVVGIERPGIMGAPVLAFAERTEADSAARADSDARVVDWQGLEAWWDELHR